MLWTFVEVRKVTEWKEGAIYKTAFVRFDWVPFPCEMYKLNEQNEMYVTASEKDSPISPIRRKDTKPTI